MKRSLIIHEGNLCMRNDDEYIDKLLKKKKKTLRNDNDCTHSKPDAFGIINNIILIKTNFSQKKI